MLETLRGHCNAGDKSSIGDMESTKVAITVGVGKYFGVKGIKIVMKIHSINA